MGSRAEWESQTCTLIAPLLWRDPQCIIMSAETDGGDILVPADTPQRAGARGKDWQSRNHSVHVHIPAVDLPLFVHLAIAELIHPYNAIK